MSQQVSHQDPEAEGDEWNSAVVQFMTLDMWPLSGLQGCQTELCNGSWTWIWFWFLFYYINIVSTQHIRHHKGLRFGIIILTTGPSECVVTYFKRPFVAHTHTHRYTLASKIWMVEWSRVGLLFWMLTVMLLKVIWRQVSNQCILIRNTASDLLTGGETSLFPSWDFTKGFVGSNASVLKQL